MKRTDSYEPTGETYGPTNAPIYMKNCRKYIKISSCGENRYLLWRDDGNEPRVNLQCKTMEQEQMDRLIEITKRPTLKERQKIADQYLKHRNIKQNEVAKRKRSLINIMENMEKKRKLNSLEKENEYKRKYILKRAHQMRVDEQGTVRSFNTTVALKKCIATWDLQQKETAKIKSDQRKEKKRQEKEAEQMRRQLFEKDEIQRQQEKEERQIFINALGAQIKERENNQKLQTEIKQSERMRFNKAMHQAGLDELNDHQQKLKNDALLREEQERINIMLQRLLDIDKEEDRIYFEKQRKATEEKLKGIEDKEAIKKEMEMKRKQELEKMAAEKIAAEEKAKFKDLMEEVLRIDNSEREWRQRELIEQKNKKKGLDEMYEQLEEQVNACRMAKAQVIEDERKEICKIARDNIADERKDLEAERKIKLANENHRMEILMQINEADRRKLQDREDKMTECNFYKINEEQKMKVAKEGMLQRLEAVKKDGLPDKYSQDLEDFIKTKRWR